MVIKNTLYCMVFLIVLVFVYGCDSNNTKEKSSDTSQQEGYFFKDEVSQSFFEFMLQKNKGDIELLMYDKANHNNTLQRGYIKIIAIFPHECTLCLPVLTHINRLSSQITQLQIIVLSEKEIQMKMYQDFLIVSDTFHKLIATNDTFPLFVDYLKRSLNIEIQDFTAPFFLLVDNNNKIVRRYECTILEEVFEIDIGEIIYNMEKNKQDFKHNKQDSMTIDNKKS